MGDDNILSDVESENEQEEEEGEELLKDNSIEEMNICAKRNDMDQNLRNVLSKYL